MAKIVLFVPYFGPFPKHMPLWVRSCAANPQIDWVLLTDQDAPPRMPPNMRYVRTSFEDIKKRFSARLGFEVSLDRPYKIVDYKPAYGYLFADMVSGYDIWGYCDVDVIFGDILAFFPEDLFNRYQKIQDLGHLAFYRNDEEINTLFMEKCPGVTYYREVFTDSLIYCFDERHGIYQIFKQRGVPQTDRRVMAAIRPYKGHFKDGISGWDRAVFYWEEGKVFMARLEKGEVETREVPYVHFRKRVMRVGDFDMEAARPFFLKPNAFIEKKPGVLSRGDIVKHRKDVPLYGITSRVKRLGQKGVTGFFQRLWVRGRERMDLRRNTGDAR